MGPHEWKATSVKAAEVDEVFIKQIITMFQESFHAGGNGCKHFRIESKGKIGVCMVTAVASKKCKLSYVDVCNVL